MKKIFRLLSIALVAVVFAACGGSSNTPEGVTKKYLQNIKDGKYEAMLKQMHFKEELTKEQQDQLLAMISEKVKESTEKKGGIASFEVKEAEIAEDGQKAKVHYTVTYGDGSIKDDSEKLVLVDGKWMIDSGK